MLRSVQFTPVARGPADRTDVLTAGLDATAMARRHFGSSHTFAGATCT